MFQGKGFDTCTKSICGWPLVMAKDKTEWEAYLISIQPRPVKQSIFKIFFKRLQLLAAA
jgi:hypothetical protein